MSKRTYNILQSVDSLNTVKVTSRTASEVQLGLCPQLIQNVRDIQSSTISSVVSEYGIRYSIENELTGCRINGINTHNVSAGIYGPFYKNIETSLHNRTAIFRGLSGDNTYNRFDISKVDDNVIINYDGGREASWIKRSKDNFQGGGNEVGVVDINFTSSSFPLCIPSSSSNGEYNIWECYGHYDTNIVIPVGDPNCTAWENSECHIKRLRVRIPQEKSFPYDTQKIYIGTCQPETSSTVGIKWLGWFYTATNSVITEGRIQPRIEKAGEWRPIYTDMSELSCKGNSIVYSTSAKFILSASILSIGLGPGDNSHSINPGGNWRGSLEFKFFFDRMEKQ